MVTIVRELAEVAHLDVANKRRKLSDVDQAPTYHTWQPSTSRSWSPADSEASAATCNASPPCQPPPPFTGTHPIHDRQPAGLAGISSLAVPSAAWQSLEHRASCDFYTPPAQRLVVSSQQQAPQLCVDFSRQQRSPACQPPLPVWGHTSGYVGSLPAAGSKRVWLESHSIAARIACGGVLPSGSQPLPHRQHLRARTSFSRLNPALQTAGSRVLPAAVEEPCATQHSGSWCHPSRTSVVVSRPSGYPLASQPAYKARCLEGAVQHAWQAVPRSPSTACRLLEQWAFALKLVPDTVRFSLHLFGRVSLKMHAPGIEVPWHGVLLLMGCLWLAAKHEECRICLPTASRVVALVGGPSVFSQAELNKAELSVLDCLGWQPLLGWDDRLHLKGQHRQCREVATVDWCRLQSLPPPLVLEGW